MLKWPGTPWSAFTDLCQHWKGSVVLAVWYSSLLGWEHSPKWLPKEKNIIKTKAQSINEAWSWKTANWTSISLWEANQLPEHTKVPCSCVTGPVPSQGQQLGTPFLCAFHQFISLQYWHHWCHTQLPTSLICHHVMFWWCHTLLGGNQHACVQMLSRNP